MTVHSSTPTNVHSIFDADAATRGDVDRHTVFLDEGGRPSAAGIVVPARFAGGSFVLDTVTIGVAEGQFPVVVMSVPGLNDIELFEHEAIDLARALLSRVAFIQSTRPDRVFSKHDRIHGGDAA